MITEQDLQQAIAECQGERHPNANTCIKLAAFLTIKNELFGDKGENRHFPEEDKMPEAPQEYSFAGSQVKEITYASDTDFGQKISGKRQDEIWPIMDELMSTLQATNRRLYDAVLRRL